jgi:antitoxin component of MazEF toxin-antitoxin module
MEKIANRKVQKVSGSNFVSLPHIWCEENNIQKGDIVELFQKGERLVIIPRKEAE